MSRHFMKRGHVAVSLGLFSCLVLLAPGASAQAAKAAQTKPALACLTDLRAFDNTLKEDGYWLHASGYGYGYPIYGYGRGTLAPITETPASGRYMNARPGYEVRMLITSANILAQRGQQAACETVLATTRTLYAGYSSDLRQGKVKRFDGNGWRLAQIDAAQPVSDNLVAYRSDQLVGTELVNPQGDNLGSVNDIVMSPGTGKVAYLVIGRGGMFGIDERYVPVPWGDFKATNGTSLLVLNATKADMDAAPRVKEDAFSSSGDFDAQSDKVNNYWLAHLAK